MPRRNGVQSRVLASDRPVEHVPQQPQRSIDGRRGQTSAVQAVDHTRLLQVGHEVVDVGGLDSRDRALAEALDEGLQPIVDRGRQREPLREHVPLLVDLGEFSERQRRGLDCRIEAAIVEGAVPDRGPQVIKCDVGLGLRTDLPVGPLRQADPPAAEASPPGVLAAVASAPLVGADLVEPHVSPPPFFGSS